MAEHHRRLPVYILLDCSESMGGSVYRSLTSAFNRMVHELKGIPEANEAVVISVITFASKAHLVVPLSELSNFYIPKLTLGCGTALGSALEMLKRRMDEEIVHAAPGKKGDYKPLCFLLTDGEPTDKWEDIADYFKANISRKKASVIAVACGPDANTNTLHRITDTVIVMKNTSDVSFKEFFKLLTASVSQASRRIDAGGDYLYNMPPIVSSEIEIARPWDDKIKRIEDRFVFLHSRCIKHKKFYIMKLERHLLDNGLFVFLGTESFALDKFDFGQDDGTVPPLKISADLLVILSCNLIGKYVILSLKLDRR